MPGFSNQILSLLSSDEFKEFLADISTPLALVDRQNRLIWCNNKFNELFNAPETGRDIGKILKIEQKNIKANEPVYLKDTGYYAYFNAVSKGGGSIVYLTGYDNSNKELLKNVAHDFNNFISNINQAADLLKHKNEEDHRKFELIDTIIKNSRRAAELTERLLYDKKSAKAEAKTRIDLKKLLTETAESIKVKAGNKITITLNLDDDLHPVYGFENSLFRSFMNLVTNALEAIEDEGEITISASNKKTDNEGFDEEIVEISVKDTGEGIAPENISKIFERKFSTKSKGRESGIGLDMVKQIVEQHGGNIDVSSSLNEGTEFTILLPPFSGEDIKTKRSSDGSDTILISDDEDELRELLGELFESYNYNVIKVSKNKEVLKLINAEEKIDLMIIDRRMPDMDGNECVREIRKINKEVPIILVSGTGSYSEEEAAGLQISKFLRKPFQFDEILEITRKILS